MRSTIACLALVALVWMHDHDHDHDHDCGRGASVPPAAAPAAPLVSAPASPIATLSLWPDHATVAGRSYHLAGCVSPPADFWSSGLPLGAYFLEPDGHIELLVDPMPGVKREVPLICGMLTHQPAAGSLLALGEPGDARLVAHRMVSATDLLR